MGGLKDLQKRLETMEDRLQASVGPALATQTSKIQKDIQKIIMTTSSSIVPGKGDRYYSGKMFESSGAQHYSDEHMVTVFEFGWIDAPKYAHVQEYGGFSVGLRVGDKEISPMNALEKIHEMIDVFGDLRDPVHEAIRKVLNE